MRRTAIGFAAVVGIAAITLTGCNKSSYQCSNGSCEVSVSGNAEVDLGSSDPGTGGSEKGGPDSFEVTGYDDGAVTISSSSDEQTVKAGETKKIGALTFKVLSVDGSSAKLHVDG